MHQVDPLCVHHKGSRDPGFRRAVSRKEPSHEVDGGDGHSHAKENAGEDTLRATFTEGEGEAGDDNCDERKPARDGAGERLLEDTHGVLPWRSSGRLGECGCGEEEAHEKCKANPGQMAAKTDYSQACFHFSRPRRE